MKFINQFKQFFMGMICMALIGAITIPVVAASNSRSIEAFFSGIKIYVDDNLISPKDGNGNPIEPFIYNGTTYLPVRAVSTALGKAVSWDGKTQSVYIGKHESSTPSIMLENLDYFTDNRNFKLWTSPKDNTGKAYTSGLIAFWRTAEREILLNGQYSKISGTFIMNYDYRSVDYKGKLTIYGDDKALYSSEVMKSGGFPSKFDVDLTGVLKLKIVLETNTNAATYTNVFGIADVGLYQ